MRVTTQMLNQYLWNNGTMNNSLLSYLNRKGTSGASINSFQQAYMAAKYEKTQKSGASGGYKKLDQKAESLQKQSQAFTDTSAESLLEKAKMSGDYSAVYKQAETFVDSYNQTAKAIGSSKDSMGSFYGTMLKQTVSGSSSNLSAIGITVQRDGTLKLDKNKLQSADVDAIEKVFGASGSFSQRVNFIAGRISNYAQSNMVSASTGYNAYGAYTMGLSSRYNFRR